MVLRPESNEYSIFHAVYIDRVPDGDLLFLLNDQLEDTISLLRGITEEKARFRYAPNKWSVKEVIGHMADTERIMSYRLLCVARGEQASLPGFDEDAYVLGAGFNDMSLEELLENLEIVRKSTLALLKGIRLDDYLRIGTVSNKPISARAILYVIAGHELHHRHVLTERYL